MRIDLSNGKREKLFEAERAAMDITIMASANGNLYFYNAKTNEMYMCREDAPSEHVKIWNGTWSKVWVGKDDLRPRRKNGYIMQESYLCIDKIYKLHYNIKYKDSNILLILKLPSDFISTRPTSAYLLNYKDFGR